MKKRLLLLTLLLTCARISFSQLLTKETVKQTCIALVALTDTALKQKQYEKVALYINTFGQLKSISTEVEEKYNTYFNSVVKRNSSLIGFWIISCEGPPIKPIYGNFQHAASAINID